MRVLTRRIQALRSAVFSGLLAVAIPVDAAIVFEPNIGRYPHDVAYRARTTGYDLYLAEDGMILAAAGRTARMRWWGARTGSVLTPLERQRSVVHHLIGSERARWHTDVPTFARVLSSDVYPGVDVFYYASGGSIEYDLVIRPGASADLIRMRWEGLDSLALSEEGELVLGMQGARITMPRPIAYQTIEGVRVPVRAEYRLSPDGEVTFDVGAIDPGEPLVIDPLIVRYASYIGGALQDVVSSVTVDRDLNVYVTGLTYSPGLATPGALSASRQGPSDLYVMKLDAEGRLVYFTYIGGSSGETGGPFPGDSWNDLEVDEEGNVYLTGTTRSRDFPVTPDAAQPVFGGGPDDVFVAKISADGSRLLYSTFLGGSGEDQARGIAIDASGSAFITGRTQSDDFPAHNAFQPSYGGGTDAFVTRVSPDGTRFLYSSFLGGNDVEVGRDIAIDEDSNVYVAGRTVSTNFPATAGAFQTRFGGAGPFGQGDAFAAKVAPDGQLVYATFLGGTRGEIAAGVAVHEGSAFVSGITESFDFPTTAASAQPQYAGGDSDGFLVKLDPEGAALVYSTYLGGAGGSDECFSVAVNAEGEAHCTGVTFSPLFPTVNGFQWSLRGQSDAFVAKLDAAGGRLLFSSYLGGSGRENGVRIAVDREGTVYVVGTTISADFPTTSSALNPNPGGNEEGFLAILKEVPDKRRRAAGR